MSMGMRVVASFGGVSEREGERIAKMLDAASASGDRQAVERLVASFLPPNASEQDFQWAVKTVMRGNRKRNKGGKITDKASSWREANSPSDYADVYKRWHWGIAHDEVVEWPDPDLPDNPLIEIGRLWELHIRLPKGGGDKVIEIGSGYKNKSYVAFDPHQKHQRMYLLLPPSVRKAAKRQLWDGNPQRKETLASLAGRIHKKAKHKSGGYPPVKVKLVGALTDIVYRTHKKGDDDSMRGSSYIHALGEESKLLPALAVDAQGRLWIASGNYECPTPGITD